MEEEPVPRVPFREALRVWIRVALLSFGGPAGQIAVMHRILVEEKRWVSENRFLHALNYCMLLPGPEAQQLATYIGWLLHRSLGGLVAGVLFVLPGFFSILVLSILYAGFHDLTFVAALFFGLKPAVMAVVVEAVMRIGKRALKSRFLVSLAAGAFIAIFFFQVSFPWLVLAAALLGFLRQKWSSSSSSIETSAPPATALDQAPQGNRSTGNLSRSLKVAALWLTLWMAPLGILAALLGTSHVFVQEGVFFSKTSVVTFGGAYAVLAYIAQEAVGTYGWLRPDEMLDGLGMAETTPGPLIQVVQFVGFMGAYRNPGSMNPMLAGILGSIVTTWVTFVPCFLWIFLGAPYVERLRNNQLLGAALSAITAAVVGVILNLAVWFSMHTIFGTVSEVHSLGARWLVPTWSTFDVGAGLIATGAFLMLFWWKRGMLTTLGLSVLAGTIYFWLVLA